MPPPPSPAASSAPDLPPPDPERALAETRAWVERAVIGLNLCPFAKGVQVKGLLRYALTRATDADGLRTALVDELRLLATTPADRTETTVLVAPWAMADFRAFNDFLAEADDALVELGLDGEIQIASFHPDFQFADAEAADITNATNRAPWPTLHLIREASIDRAVAAVPEAEMIYEVNMATLRQLGPAGWAQLRAQCRADAEADPAPNAASEGKGCPGR